MVFLFYDSSMNSCMALELFVTNFLGWDLNNKYIWKKLLKITHLETTFAYK